jgi:hypothetical protein
MYRENFLLVERLNAEETGSLVLGMTRFAAMNIEEFRKLVTTDLTPS